jgi:hypothetical protein
MGETSAEQEVKQARDEQNGGVIRAVIRANSHEGALGPGRWVEEREASEHPDALTPLAVPGK